MNSLDIIQKHNRYVDLREQVDQLNQAIVNGDHSKVVHRDQLQAQQAITCPTPAEYSYLSQRCFALH